MKEKIKEYIEKELIEEKEEINLSFEDDILSNGLIDSMEAMQLITFLENSFGINIPPEDMVIENFITINAIGNYIESQKS